MRATRGLIGIFLLVGAIITLSASVNAQDEYEIPQWIRSAVAFWVEGHISDQEFINIIQYFVENEIIKVPEKEAASDLEMVDKLRFFQAELNNKIRFLQALSNNPEVQKVVSQSNEEFASMYNVDITISKRDEDWRATNQNEITPFMNQLINNEAGLIMQAIIQTEKQEDGLFTFEEIFVTNSYGVNAAQSGKTSDYLQADEDWWNQAKQNGIYLEEGQYDESTGVYATDITIRVVDRNGNFVGVMKGVINVEKLFS